MLGPQLALMTIFLAAFAGTAWRGPACSWRASRPTPWRRLPFGTLLAPAAMVAFLWGDRWLQAYVALIR